MSIQKARDLLWELAISMTDKELEAFIIQCKRIASIIVDFAEKETTEK